MERLALSRDGFSPPPVPLDPDFLLKSSGRYEQFSTILGKAPTEQFCWVIPQSISSLNLLRLSFGPRRLFTDAFKVQSVGDGEHLITLGRLQSSVPNSPIADVLSGRVPASAIVDGMLPKSLEGDGVE